MSREVSFSYRSSLGIKVPYVREVFDYANDGSGGYLEFDGYWYRMRIEYDEVPEADDRIRYVRRDVDPLPCELIFYTKLVADEPCETGVDASGNHQELFQLTECQRFRVLATAHTEIQDTSEFWSDEEDGGHICLFPTARQRIEFRVIEQLECESADVRTVTHCTLILPCSDGGDISASVSIDSILSE